MFRGMIEFNLACDAAAKQRSRQHAPGYAFRDPAAPASIAQLDLSGPGPHSTARLGQAQSALARTLEERVDQRRRRGDDEGNDVNAEPGQQQPPPAHIYGWARVNVAVTLTRPAVARASTRQTSRRTCCACSAATQLSQSANATAPSTTCT